MIGILVDCSDHPDYPPTNEFTRGEVVVTIPYWRVLTESSASCLQEAALYLTATETGCRYVSIMMMDIKGSVPVWAINQATTSNLSKQAPLACCILERVAVLIETMCFAERSLR